MANDSFTTLNVSSSSRHKSEGAYVITEGRLEHLEAIADEIEKYEKLEPRWDIQKNALSAFGAIGLSGVGLLVSEHNLQYKTLILSTTIAAGFVFIMAGISIYRHHIENKEKHDFRAKKLKEIIAKVRGSLEQNEDW